MTSGCSPGGRWRAFVHPPRLSSLCVPVILLSILVFCYLPHALLRGRRLALWGRGSSGPTASRLVPRRPSRLTERAPLLRRRPPMVRGWPPIHTRPAVIHRWPSPVIIVLLVMHWWPPAVAPGWSTSEIASSPTRHPVALIAQARLCSPQIVSRKCHLLLCNSDILLTGFCISGTLFWMFDLYVCVCVYVCAFVWCVRVCVCVV